MHILYYAKNHLISHALKHILAMQNAVENYLKNEKILLTHQSERAISSQSYWIAFPLAIRVEHNQCHVQKIERPWMIKLCMCVIHLLQESLLMVRGKFVRTSIIALTFTYANWRCTPYRESINFSMNVNKRFMYVYSFIHECCCAPICCYSCRAISVRLLFCSPTKWIVHGFPFLSCNIT